MTQKKKKIIIYVSKLQLTLQLNQILNVYMLELNIASMESQIKQLRQKNIQLQNLLADQRQIRKKEQSIWQKLNQSIKNTQLITQIKKKHQQQIIMLKNDALELVKENQTLRQKVQQMKVTLTDTKQLVRYFKQIHEREVALSQMESKLISSKSSVLDFSTQESIKENDQKTQLKKTKQLLESRLQKCAQISKQMEQYYTSQLQSKDEVIRQQFEQIKRLKIDIELMNQQLRRASYRQFPQQIVANSRSTISDYHSLSKSIVTNKQQRYQYMIDFLKDKYETQINNYKDKVKYLLLKIQSLQNSRDQYQDQQSSKTEVNNVLQMSKHSNYSQLNQFTPNSSQYSCNKGGSYDCSTHKYNAILKKHITNKTPLKIDNSSHTKNNSSRTGYENTYYKNSKR